MSNDVDRDAIRGVAMVRSPPNQGAAVVREIRGYPEVEALHSTTGVWDLVVQLRSRSLSDLDLALQRIRGIAGVQETRTSRSSTPSPPPDRQPPSRPAGGQKHPSRPERGVGAGHEAAVW